MGTRVLPRECRKKLKGHEHEPCPELLAERYCAGA
jgi:hypothetical protein